MIKSVRTLNIDYRHKYVNVKRTYSGSWESCAIRSSCTLGLELNIRPLYARPLRISLVKMKDLQSLVPYLSKEESRAFYDSLSVDVGRRNGDDDANVSGPRVDDDNNSSGCED